MFEQVNEMSVASEETSEDIGNMKTLPMEL